MPGDVEKRSRERIVHRGAASAPRHGDRSDGRWFGRGSTRTIFCMLKCMQICRLYLWRAEDGADLPRS